jgi:hypothetical protein
MRRSWALFYLVLAPIAAGCQLGFDDLTLGDGGGTTGSTSATTTNAGGATGTGGGSSTTTTGSGGGAITTTGSGGDGCVGVCAPPPPVGYDGPFLFPAGNACPSPLTNSRPLGTSVATTQADCACELPPGAPECAVTLVEYTDASCTQVATNTTDFAPSVPAACETLPLGSKSGTPFQPSTEPTGIACSAPVPPPTVYVDPRVQCDLGTPPACDGGVCIASGAPADVCIMPQSGTSCPATGDYTVAHTLVSAATSCNCGNANYFCAGTTQIYSGLNACQNEIGATAITNQCTDLTSPAYAKFIPDNPNLFVGKCGTPQATLGMTQAVTICCLQ